MSFHTYRVNEVFSNADGTVQFIELVEGDGFNGQNQWNGHGITVSQDGAATHSFNFTSNLPSANTANTKVLLATQGFANLGLVTPDFIIPNGFLFTSGSATVNFAGVDAITYTTLPLDGSHSLSRNLSVSDNSPTNFAGVVGSVVPPPNHAPVVATPIPDQTGIALRSFTLAITENQFTDVDAGDSLALSATRADGTALPSWLNFNPGSRTFTGTPGATDTGVLTIRVTATDKLGATAKDDFVLTIDPPAPAINGTLVADKLVGTPSDDLINGLDGNDFLTGGLGNDTLNGGSGIDTAVFSGTRAQSTVSGVANGTVSQVSGPDGVDALLGIERLQFKDFSLAFDLGGAAGSTAKLLGAVFGAAAVHNKLYAGVGISLLDGGTTYGALADLAVQAAIGTAPSNAALVTLLYTNVVGTAPDAATVAAFSSLITSGQFTQTTLTTFAADHVLNTTHIDLNGLAQTGLEFTPLIPG